MDAGGDLLGGGVELLFGLSTDNRGRFSLPGCLFSILILVAIGYGIYYFNKSDDKVKPTNKECGTLITKLKNNEVIVLLNGEKVVRKISNDLYLNTDVEEEICFTKK